MNGEIRQFETGATRDQSKDKLDFEGFLSPAVLVRYAEYLHKHRIQSDGQLRDSDNWQKGIPLNEYAKSALRHVIEFWKVHRGLTATEDFEDTICAVIFNMMGYLFELLKSKRVNQVIVDEAFQTYRTEAEAVLGKVDDWT